MSPINIQKQIFAQIEEKIKPRKLSVELGKILSIAQAAVYRRLSGETLLSFEQLFALVNHYNVSLDSLASPSSVLFQLPSLDKPPKNIYEYLSQSEYNLESLYPPSKSLLRYVAVEIPFYYYLYFPALAAFKFYMWGRTLWYSDRGMYAKFDMQEYIQDIALQALMQRIVKLNEHIPAEEIWNDCILDITYNQIRYCWKVGVFTHKKDVELILESIRQLLDHLEAIAETGSRASEKSAVNIQIWDNELFQNPMIVLSETGGRKLIYCNIDVPYFMVSNNSDMYEIGLNFCKRIQAFSNTISTSNEMNRHNYFSRLREKWNNFEKDMMIQLQS